MFNKVFKDSGKKIKFAAPICAIALGAFSIIMSTFFMTLSKANIILGLILLVLGVGLSCLIGLLIYGFGEIVELVEKVSPKDEKLSSFIPLLMETGESNTYEGDNAVFCDVCGASNRPVAKFCVVCGAEMKEEPDSSDVLFNQRSLDEDDYDTAAPAVDYNDGFDDDMDADESVDEPVRPVDAIPTATVTFRRSPTAKKKVVKTSRNMGD